MWRDKSDLTCMEGQFSTGRVWSKIAKVGPGKTCSHFFKKHVLGLLSVCFISLE
jgi:hypothetical protein